MERDCNTSSKPATTALRTRQVQTHYADRAAHSHSKPPTVSLRGLGQDDFPRRRCIYAHNDLTASFVSASLLTAPKSSECGLKYAWPAGLRHSSPRPGTRVRQIALPHSGAA